MKISFVIVGNEIVSGFREEKNFRYASNYLKGYDIYVQIVGDNKRDMIMAFYNAEKFADFIVVSGGLGSTPDDLTRFVAAKYFQRKIVKYGEAWEHIVNFFKARGREPGIYHEIQSLFPEGAELIINKTGTAFGFKMRKEGEGGKNYKTFFFLPGVPSEFQIMFKEFVLQELPKENYYEKIFKVFGLTETQILEKIKLLEEIDDNKVKISYLPKFPEVTLKIYSEDERVVEEYGEKIKKALGDFIYAEDDKSLAEVVVNLLYKKNIKLVVIESFTGGELQNMITDVPGASKVLVGGVVAYTPEAKISFGVPREVVESGMVSRECALEMAKSAMKLGGDIAISTTGSAGPEPLEKKPGTFYIGFAGIHAQAYEFYFPFQRKELKILASYLALSILRKVV